MQNIQSRRNSRNSLLNPFRSWSVGLGLGLFFSSNLLAAPIDLHGVFGVDMSMLNTFRKSSAAPVNTGNDSQSITAPAGNDSDAAFESYKLRLIPTVVVNDSVTFHSEITTGYGLGGRLGDSSINKKAPANKSFGNALYFHNTYSDTSNLILNKFNVELFADTATWVIGRQSMNWGLGAFYNDGEQVWDRHMTIKDGVRAKFKIGSFHIHPFYFKNNAVDTLTKYSAATEIGATALYDNSERDLAFGILFAIKSSKDGNNQILNTAGTNVGNSSAKITDLFLKKSFNKLTLGIEVPLISGDAGFVYNANSKAKFKSMAILTETTYAFNDSWSAALHMGTVTGDDGANSSFEAMYLHPNYQIANLMFRYNMDAVSNPTTQNIFDSYMTNVQYAKLSGKYEVDSWRLSLAYIMAKANTSAKAGGTAFNHTKNKAFTSNFNQSKDYGSEIDFNGDYKWSENVNIGGTLGYQFVGKYYAFTNRAAEQSVKDSYALVFRTSIRF